MTSDELRQKYLKFFESKGHQIIPPGPLVPEDDPTTLFTTAGMQALIPYLLGKPHPQGKSLVNSQPCFRAQDIEEVGDNRHTTFFEMLGNWSLGDYFKEKQLPWIFEFLTEVADIDPKKLYVTVFAGDEKYKLPRDTESAEIWKELFSKQGIDSKEVELGSVENASEVGTQGGRIFYYDQRKNWWSRASSIEAMPAGEPGGPNSEMFYEFTQIEHDPKFGKYCHPNCDCGRFLEIGNSVFMKYQKQEDGSVKELPNKNVDFGGGLERILATSQNEPDIFKIDLFCPIIEQLEEKLGVKYGSHNKITEALRIVADHLKASVFLISEGVRPSNKLQGYVLRRILRRSAVKTFAIKKDFDSKDFKSVVETIIGIYPDYFQTAKIEEILAEVSLEIRKFRATIEKGLKEIGKYPTITGKIAFDLFQTYGFPLELTEELAEEKGLKIDREEFKKEFEKHKELSRTASAGMFKGGLGEQSEITTKYHTATHLLHAALRKILGEHVQQKGSNITADRMRFDFSHPEKLTEEQLKEVEELVNEKIKENLPVASKEMSKEDALSCGALGFFTEKYGDKVTVYTIGNPSAPSGRSGSLFSREICGGPHVQNTKELGTFKITREESASAGVRRIYATLS